MIEKMPPRSPFHSEKNEIGLLHSFFAAAGSYSNLDPIGFRGVDESVVCGMVYFICSF